MFSDFTVQRVYANGKLTGLTTAQRTDLRVIINSFQLYYTIKNTVF